MEYNNLNYYNNSYNSNKKTNGKIFDFDKNDNFDDYEYKNQFTNTLNNHDISTNKDNSFINLLINNKNNNNLYRIFNRKKINKKGFNNKLLRLNINKYPYKLYDLNNNFSLEIKTSLFDKFKYLPNIKKYHNLTNEKLIQLTKVSEDENSFLYHKQRINNNIFKEYINNIPQTSKNKSMKNNKNKLTFNLEKNKNSYRNLTNIRDNALNSKIFDINYTPDIHISWAGLFNKKKKTNLAKTQKQLINKKYKITSAKTISTDNSININNLNNTINKEKDNNNNSDEQKINIPIRRFRRSSTIDRLLFKLTNKDECYEEYISDGKPGDKYLYFKNQLIRKKKSIERELLELRRHQN
jgi:hypothetical protein